MKSTETISVLLSCSFALGKIFLQSCHTLLTETEQTGSNGQLQSRAGYSILFKNRNRLDFVRNGTSAAAIMPPLINMNHPSMLEPPLPSLRKSFTRSTTFAAAAILATALVIWQVALLAEEWGLEKIRQTGESRLTLHADALRDTLEKYRHIPYILSRDSRIRGLLEGTVTPVKVNPHLEDFALTAETLIFVMDKTGQTVAASNWRTEQSLIGNNFAFRPYFQDALAGKSGGYYAVGFKTRKPGFFISYPVLETGKLLGVVVVKVDLEKLQNTWRESGETIIVSDASGVLFLSSRPEWQYQSLRPLPSDTANWLREAQYLERPLTTLVIKREITEKGNILHLATDTFLEQSRQLLDYSWRIHYLSDLAPVASSVHLAEAVTAVIAVSLIFILLFLRERRQKLISRQEAREALAIRRLNERLMLEIAGHKETERTLRITQDELIQAGKLAALGRMSAAIAHELNQPVTAIRTFIASCRIFLDRQQLDKVGENLDFIDRLTERMTGITGQLKTFARKSRGRREPVDLCEVVNHVLTFFTPQFEHIQVRVTRQLPEKGSAMVFADELQLEQVLNNIVSNSLDAMKDRTPRMLRITLTTSSDFAFLSCRDSGKGIDEKALDLLFDPFFTTKDIGEGLGLGLSISYGIVREMDGTIKAENHPEGGALFTLQLPLAKEYCEITNTEDSGQ